MLDFTPDLLLDGIQANLEDVGVLAVLRKDPPACHLPTPRFLLGGETFVPFRRRRVGGNYAGKIWRGLVELAANPVALRRVFIDVAASHRSEELRGYTRPAHCRALPVGGR